MNIEHKEIKEKSFDSLTIHEIISYTKHSWKLITTTLISGLIVIGAYYAIFIPYYQSTLIINLNDYYIPQNINAIDIPPKFSPMLLISEVNLDKKLTVQEKNTIELILSNAKFDKNSLQITLTLLNNEKDEAVNLLGITKEIILRDTIKESSNRKKHILFMIESGNTMLARLTLYKDELGKLSQNTSDRWTNAMLLDKEIFMTSKYLQELNGLLARYDNLGGMAGEKVKTTRNFPSKIVLLLLSVLLISFSLGILGIQKNKTS